MIEKVAVTSSQDALSLLQKLDAACMARLGNGQMTPSDMSQMASVWYAVDHWTEAQAWAWRMYNAVLGGEDARAKADEEALVAVSGTCYKVQALINNDHEHQAFATAAANLAAAGKLEELWNLDYYFNCGAMVMMPKSRAILEAALVDAQGHPRLPVAKILAWGYQEGGHAAQWRDLIAGKRDGASSADAKALWSAALGYAEALLTPNMRYTRWKTRLNEALALAQSDQVRLAVIDDTAACLMDMNWLAIGVNQLESIKSQFTGDRAAVHISDLQDKLRQKEANRLAKEASNRAGASVLQEQARLQDCRRLLAQATASGDGASVARLQATILQLRQELGD
jgi:hypothetical protein